MLPDWGPLALVHAEPEGRWTAQVVGLPELRVSGDTREQAVESVQKLLLDTLASGHLVTLSLSNPLIQQAGSARNDPTYPALLEEIRRYREELDRGPGDPKEP
jgi:hypothetical protein